MSDGYFLALRKCSASSYSEAGKEIATTLFASLLPIWLGLVITVVLSREGASRELVFDFLTRNEALMVSAALVGPLIYTISRKYGDVPKTLTIRFPYGLLFILLAFAICLTAAAMYGLSVAAVTVNDGTVHPTNEYLDKASFMYLSGLALIMSIAVLFFVSALRNDMDRPAPQVMVDEMQKFRKAYDK